MEGLIPYLLHAIKKQRPNQHHSFRCLSDASNRSYHMLIGADSAADGSSHHGRINRSEFRQAPVLDHFSDQRSPGRVNYFSNGAGPMMSPVASKTAVTSGYEASFSMAGTVTHR